MKAKFQGIEVEGTVEEIVKLKNILDTQKLGVKQWITTKGVTLKNSCDAQEVVQKVISQLKDSISNQKPTF